jgi:acetyl-CoA carboxylase alpha subunit
MRSIICLGFAVSLGVAVPVAAQEHGAQRLVAPSAAVAAAWTREASTPRSLKALYVSYGALQGLDMYSTIVARQNGAREMNPIMNTRYARASVVKALMVTGTFAAVKNLEKKNRRAAVFTVVGLNVVTAAIVANNFRNARGGR